jgi:predicted dienelactone hydrolase
LDGFTQLVARDADVVGGNHPLIVLSHGTGGLYSSHYDTALILAHAGFVVAALTHPQDNSHDGSRATDLPARPRQLRNLISGPMA